MKSIFNGEEEPGERIIPAADNAALIQGEMIQLVASWGDEPPSKRELLEQILAEQRKTNELLAEIAFRAP